MLSILQNLKFNIYLKLIIVYNIVHIQLCNYIYFMYIYILYILL